MKIAFLNIYNGVVDRGAETFVKELAKRLAKNHEVTLYQSGHPRKTVYKTVRIPVNWNWSNKSGAGTLRARFFIDYWNRQIAYFTLRAMPRILKNKYDVVVPVNGGWQPAIIRIITWLYGGKMIISGQAGMGWDERNNLWSFPDFFVGLSTKASAWAKKVNPFVKTQYISNGVDTNKFKHSGEPIKTVLKKPIILCAGALTKSKRIDLVIKAVAKVENCTLLIVGDGDQKEKLTSLGASLLENRFQIIKVPYEKMPAVYKSANVFTLVSESFYAFENVLVEAMATGLAVVVNDDPIRREIVGDAGIFVDPTDTEKYSEALSKALNKNWGNAPRKQAEKFDWDIIAKKYEELFKIFTS